MSLYTELMLGAGLKKTQLSNPQCPKGLMLGFVIKFRKQFVFHNFSMIFRGDI